jgi:drug/metabolite transporter (DMT)-like permease
VTSVDPEPARGRPLRTQLLGAGLVAVSAVAYGSGPLFARSVYATGVDWLGTLAWRFVLAAIAMWIWLWASRTRRAAARRVPRARVAQLFVVGGLFACSSAAAYASIALVPVTLYGLIQAMAPALVAVLTLRFGKRLRGRVAWSALAIATLGLALTVGGVAAPADPGGVVLAAAAPVIYAVYVLLMSRVAGERRGAVAVERASPPPAAVAGPILVTAAASVFIVAGALAREPILPWQVPAAAWPGLLGVGLISAAIAMQAFYAGATRIGAAYAGLIQTLEPVSTVALALVLLGERLTEMQVAGGALVLGAVVLSQLPLAGARPRLRPPARP